MNARRWLRSPWPQDKDEAVRHVGKDTGLPGPQTGLFQEAAPPAPGRAFVPAENSHLGKLEPRGLPRAQGDVTVVELLAKEGPLLGAGVGVLSPWGPHAGGRQAQTRAIGCKTPGPEVSRGLSLML